MTREEFIKEVKEVAATRRQDGAYLEINHNIPYVAIDLGPQEYYFQGEEASDLIDSCPDDLNLEDFILWSACGWG